MTTTAVWAGDIKPVSWSVTSDGAAGDLSAATVRLLAQPLSGGAVVELTNVISTSVVTHTLTGTLAVGRYQVVIEATQGGQVITYPDTNAEQHHLTVTADIG